MLQNTWFNGSTIVKSVNMGGFCYTYMINCQCYKFCISLVLTLWSYIGITGCFCLPEQQRGRGEKIHECSTYFNQWKLSGSCVDKFSTQTHQHNYRSINQRTHHLTLHPVSQSGVLAGHLVLRVSLACGWTWTAPLWAEEVSASLRLLSW